ncbi:MAG: helix-turn-helix transcriptional regulator [Alphaproteobacteria bacterium]|nr:helix-turn-helix transcriptional regulator [Alphaproteobacteria bacterium]
MTDKQDFKNNVLDTIDEYIGSRIRLRRNLLGLSQDDLAKKLNISFQQIQKYEKGTNRISGSRIWQLARILNIPAGYFFDGVEAFLAHKGLDISKYANDCFCEDIDFMIAEQPIPTQQSAKELLNAFSDIQDTDLANNVLDLIKTISKKEKRKEKKK